jgi:hypothetical protein
VCDRRRACSGGLLGAAAVAQIIVDHTRCEKESECNGVDSRSALKQMLWFAKRDLCDIDHMVVPSRDGVDSESFAHSPVNMPSCIDRSTVLSTCCPCLLTSISRVDMECIVNRMMPVNRHSWPVNKAGDYLFTFTFFLCSVCIRVHKTHTSWVTKVSVPISFSDPYELGH